MNNRILIVDDDKDIHDDFKKILRPPRFTELDQTIYDIESHLFDEEMIIPGQGVLREYQIDSAYQAKQALDMIEASHREGNPYVLVFADVRMPPGLDGVQLVKKIRQLYPFTEVVIMTAFSDYTWEEMTEIFGWGDHLLMLRKPVDTITFKQVTLTLTKKWCTDQAYRQQQEHLETLVEERTKKLTIANQRLQEEIAERKQAKAELQRAHRELAKANEGLHSQILKRTETEKQLKLLLIDLERANKELQDFSYIASHDLKTPLRDINSIASWFSEDYADVLDDQGRQYLGGLLSGTKRMYHLLEDILHYLEVSRNRGKQEPVDSGALIREIIQGLNLKSGIKIEVDENLPNVIFDRSRLSVVFNNLLENAVKHMDKNENGLVKVTAQKFPGFWRFAVSDNGVGIEARHFERIFKIFQTLKPVEEVEGSTGIGLPLVRKIVEFYGGKAWVESQVGQGATFLFTVPQRHIHDIEPGSTVLIIDDNPEFSEITAKILNRVGFDTLQAVNDLTAKELINNHRGRIQAALLDVNLPLVDTQKLYEDLRRMRPFMKVVLCSGMESAKARGLLALGADALILKPFSIDELVRILQHGESRHDVATPKT